MEDQVRQELNRRRVRAVLSSRHFKELFAWAVPTSWLFRWLFRDGNGGMRRVGEHVLADLRGFCRARLGETIFDSDPLIMARREGRREVFMRIVYFLNLDEREVQQLMELDDGIG